MTGKKHRRKQRAIHPAILATIGVFMIGFGFLAAAPKGALAVNPPGSLAPAQVNFEAPELSLSNVDGGMESLADYRGEVVLVNNWATWCPPCRAEMPVLVSYYNKYRTDGFSVIAVEAGDPADVVSQFAQNFGMNFPVWLDPDMKSLRAIGKSTLPNSYAIDRQGLVRFVWMGEINTTMLEEYITPLIEGNG